MYMLYAIMNIYNIYSIMVAVDMIKLLKSTIASALVCVVALMTLSACDRDSTDTPATEQTTAPAVTDRWPAAVTVTPDVTGFDCGKISIDSYDLPGTRPLKHPESDEEVIEIMNEFFENNRRYSSALPFAICIGFTNDETRDSFSVDELADINAEQFNIGYDENPRHALYFNIPFDAFKIETLKRLSVDERVLSIKIWCPLQVDE